MITSRDEYDFVSVDDPLRVDGGVMPLRENPGELRAEDVAFCLEAAHERATVAGTKPPSEDKVSRFIFGHRWQDAIKAIQASAAHAVADDYEFVSDYLGDSFAGAALRDHFKDCAFDVDDLSADPVMFGSGSAIRRQPIIDVFDDLRKVTRFRVDRDFGYGEFARTSDHFDLFEEGDEYEYNPHETATDVNLFRAVYQKVKGAAPGLGNRTWTTEASADQGEVEFDIPGCDYVGECQVVVLVDMAMTSRTVPAQQKIEEHYVAIVLDAEASEGKARVDVVDLLDASLAFWESNFGDLPTIADVTMPGDYGAMNYIWFRVSYSPVQAIFVPTLGDHTKWWPDGD